MNKDIKNTVFKMRMSEEEKKRLEELAEANGVGMSKYVMLLLEEEYKKLDK